MAVTGPVFFQLQGFQIKHFAFPAVRYVVVCNWASVLAFVGVHVFLFHEVAVVKVVFDVGKLYHRHNGPGPVKTGVSHAHGGENHVFQTTRAQLDSDGVRDRHQFSEAERVFSFPDAAVDRQRQVAVKLHAVVVLAHLSDFGVVRFHRLAGDLIERTELVEEQQDLLALFAVHDLFEVHPALLVESSVLGAGEPAPEVAATRVLVQHVLLVKPIFHRDEGLVVSDLFRLHPRVVQVSRRENEPIGLQVHLG